MATTFRTRQLQVNQVVYDQVDIFQSDLFTRITGLQPVDVTLTLFLNNQVVAWPLVDGTGVDDSQVVAGEVFWNQLPNGGYGIRFFPNSLGHWNLAISYNSTSPAQIVAIDFDVVNLPLSVDNGLRADFCS